MQIVIPDGEEIDTTEIEIAARDLQDFISQQSKRGQASINAYAIAVLLMAEAIAEENAPLLN